jgi:YHS domain-containing protein
MPSTMQKKEFKVKKLVLLVSVLPALFLPATSATAQCGGHDHSAMPGHDHSGMKAASEKEAQTSFTGTPYLLTVDPVSGKALPAKPAILAYKGRELRFADKSSQDAFLKDPARYLPAVDAGMIAQQLPFYPLETCVVSGEKLGGDMGPAVDRIIENRLVRLCCKACISKVEKDPGKYLGALDQAIVEAQIKSYPTGVCVVSDEDLASMDAPVNVILGSRLVRLCCANCEKKLRADPTRYLAKLSKS